MNCIIAEYFGERPGSRVIYAGAFFAYLAFTYGLPSKGGPAPRSSLMKGSIKAGVYPEWAAVSFSSFPHAPFVDESC